MRSALRQLATHGIEALRPQKVNNKWRKPAVSARIASDLRKLAIRSGTYGTFDAETGQGWDPLWDHAPKSRGADANNDDISSQNKGGGNYGGIQLTLLRPPKETKRQRNREARAQKIEKLMEGMDQRIEEFRLEKEAKKPPPGIEEEFKRYMKSSRY
jgi:hypothetical protein